LTVQQWEILKDPNRDLLGGFLKKWENEKVLHVVFIEEKKKQISNTFDEILKLEPAKTNQRINKWEILTDFTANLTDGLTQLAKKEIPGLLNELGLFR